MPDPKVLVVGTTADYIDLIRHRYPDRALFVTDFTERRAFPNLAPPESDEVLCDFRRPDEVGGAVASHVARYDQQVTGVACYDCESLLAAATLARAYTVPFVSEHSVALSRNKFETKQAWLAAGVPCPKTALVKTMWDALRFFDEIKGPVVLKPLSGAGSELTFRCTDRSDVTQAYARIRDGLNRHHNDRLYPVAADGDPTTNPRQVIAVEEFVEGREYSCDFTLDHGRVTVVRVARKIRAAELPFGTTLAYQVPARLPGGMTEEVLVGHLQRAAEAMGMTRAFCMVDFIMRDDIPVFLELTPRPGGDCLPPLIRHAGGLDMLGLELDFAEGKPLVISDATGWKTLFGVRMFAKQPGRIVRLDTRNIETDPRVKECYLKRSVGHHVVLPPDDYDTWLIGHIIFEPKNVAAVEAECRELVDKLLVEMETPGHETRESAGTVAFKAVRAADAGA